MSCLDSSARWKAVTEATPYRQSYDGQCCQLLAEVSDQFDEKIWPLRKKLDTPSNFHCFKGIYALEKKRSPKSQRRHYIISKWR